MSIHQSLFDFFDKIDQNDQIAILMERMKKKKIILQK